MDPVDGVPAEFIASSRTGLDAALREEGFAEYERCAESADQRVTQDSLIVRPR